MLYNSQIMTLEIATYFPKQVLTNEEIASWNVLLGGKPLTAQSIRDKVGVERRFLARADETVLDMGKQSVQALPSPQAPDMVFFSTSYPDGENNAYEIAKSLNSTAGDCTNVHAACSGTTLALSYMFEHQDRFLGQRILLVASEKYSPTLIDLKSGQEDPSLSQTIFSDGAVTWEFTEGQDLKILNALNYSFPREKSACLRMPINYDLVRYPALTIDIPASEDGFFWMNGKAVYEGVREIVPGLICAAIEEVGLETQQVRMVIPHQASRHMLEALAKRLPALQIYSDLEDGNWSSASIPKAMLKALNEGAVRSGDRIVLVGFGAGLFASVAILELG